MKAKFNEKNKNKRQNQKKKTKNLAKNGGKFSNIYHTIKKGLLSKHVKFHTWLSCRGFCDIPNVKHMFVLSSPITSPLSPFNQFQLIN